MSHPLAKEPRRPQWIDARNLAMARLIGRKVRRKPELFPEAMAFRTKNTGGVTGWCVEIHDLATSKLAAGRPKDLAYIRALFKHKLIKRAILEERLADTEIHPNHRADLLETLRRLSRPKAKRK